MEKITKIVELDIDDPRFDEELFEDYGVNIISLVDRPAIGVDFMSFNQEFITPSSGEDKDEFLQRCMSELNNEFPDQDQRYAVCNSYWEEYRQEDKSEELVFSEEAQCALIDFAENNGEFISEDDLILDLTKSEFSTIGNVITAIRSLDILKRLIIKKNEKPETYYRYTGPRPQRNFCKAMINLTNAGKIFTQDEIEKMDGINAQFARKGSSSYSIFKFKGGKNCKHYWQKLDVFKNEFGQRVIIVGQPVTNVQETASKTWNQLSEEVYNFSIDEEKRIVLGPVMIPNKMILRRDEENNPFYVYFKKNTIQKMSEKFLAKNLLHNTDVNHDNNVTQENTLLESWISESILHDKAYKYGFNLPVGTWYVSYKINNEDIWKDIKEKRLKGFSLAGGFITRLNDNNTLNQIKNILKNIDE